MSERIEIKVPDIGDYTDVPVIEILIAVGDTVKKDQGLVTLESDKATLEVPSSAAGVVKELKVKLGDSLSEGSVVAILEAEGAASAAAAPEAPKSTEAAPSKPPVAPSHRAPAEPPAPKPALGSGKAADIECRLVVLGSGPGGYTAAFRAADLGLDTVMIERYSSLGGVCLNVGCIPSKALLHAAALIEEAAHSDDIGISFGKPKIDLDKLRGFKQDKVVGQFTKGLAGMAKQRKVRTVQGVASFVSPNELEIVGEDGKSQLLRFEQCIVAAGSQAVKLPAFPWDDPRVMDSTDALQIVDVPKQLLVVGGGIIGLEMATVYRALGSQVTVVEFMDQLMPGADKDLVKPLADRLKKQGVAIHLKTRATKVEASKKGISVDFESATEGQSAEIQTTTYDRVLVAVGRSPNGNKIGADKAGVSVTDRGFIPVDRQMRSNVPHIFAIGDIVGNPMLAHKATHEGKLAAEVATGEGKPGKGREWVARVIPSVAYTDPEIAWVGVTETEAKAKGLKVGVGKFPWVASARAVGIGRGEGFTKLVFDEETHRVIGGGIVGVHAGDLITEISLAIEMGADAADIGHTIHPHPTLSESVGMAAEVFDGTITDLYIPQEEVKSAMNKLSALLLGCAVAVPASADTVVVTAARMIDVVAGKVVDQPQVTITDGRISAVGKRGDAVPEGAQRIDLGARTLLPGLIDMHVHLTSDPTISGYRGLEYTDNFWTVVGVANAKKTIEAGFTTVRNVGSGNYDDVAIKQGVDGGYVPGPRIVPATYAIGATGGHCDNTEFPPSVHVDSPAVADSPEAIRAVVRKLRKYGAEVIKFCATGGVLSKTDSVGGQQYSLAEMTALVEEAHQLGMRVAVHAHGTSGINDAIRAGADTIEHCSLADAESFKLAKAHGTWFSMDIYNDDYILAEGEKNGVFAESLEKERVIGRKQRETFRAAHAAGVKLVFGTDGGVYPNGNNALQFAKMVEWGMTPMEAIQAATSSAAEALGRAKDVGAIETGRYGDLIAVDSDPIADVSNLTRVVFVMKGGKVIKQAP